MPRITGPASGTGALLNVMGPWTPYLIVLSVTPVAFPPRGRGASPGAGGASATTGGPPAAGGAEVAVGPAGAPGRGAAVGAGAFVPGAGGAPGTVVSGAVSVGAATAGSSAASVVVVVASVRSEERRVGKG